MNRIIIRKIQGNQNNKRPSQTVTQQPATYSDEEAFGIMLRRALANNLENHPTAANALLQRERQELERRNKVDFVYRSLARAFEVQAKELIASNIDQFYEMGEATAYLTLLTILADFNKKA